MNNQDCSSSNNMFPPNKISLIWDQQQQPQFTKMVETISKQHKEFQLFKQLIKRQSRILEQYLVSMISISRQFNSSLFDGFHFHLTSFQQELQNQYVLLKQQGKHFYVIKQEAQICQKKLEKTEITIADSTKSESAASIKQQNLIESQHFWNDKQDYSILRMKDVSFKGERITSLTSQLIDEFIEKHKFRIGTSHNNSAKKTTKPDSNQASYNKQCRIPTILTLDNFDFCEERVGFTDSEQNQSQVSSSFLESKQLTKQ